MNKIRLCVFSAIIIVFITSCGPGTTDWSYELPNGYRISRYNSKEVFVAGGRACTSDPKYIKCSVTDFAYDDRYVFTKHCLNDDEMYYYILDTEKELLYGAYDNMEKMKIKAKELGVGVPEGWISTENKPDI